MSVLYCHDCDRQYDEDFNLECPGCGVSATSDSADAAEGAPLVPVDACSGRKSMTSTNPQPSVREAVARVIDPDAWADADKSAGKPKLTPGKFFPPANEWVKTQPSLTKADQIIALVREALPDGGGSAREPAFSDDGGDQCSLATDAPANADHDRALSFVRRWLSEPLDPDQHPEWLNLARAYAQAMRSVEATEKGAELWERSAQLIRDGSRFGGDAGDREFGCGMQEALRALGVPKP